MSAIWGIIGFDNDNIAAMFESEYKNHCKLDKYSHFSKDGAYFGSGIQYITNESRTEALPIYDETNGILFTADCILDNRSELISLLRSVSCYNHKNLALEPDGTLMYLAYQSLGIECVKHFRGLFAIAIWDYNKKMLTLISDQVSARCLYYIKTDTYIGFSTLLSPLCRYDSSLSFNDNYFKDFLLSETETIYTVPGETPYKDVKLMLPATYVNITKSDISYTKYWSMPVYPHYGTVDDISSTFMSIYKACISDALRVSDNSEIGLAMSSGLDSSSIGAIASKLLGTKGKHLKTYTFTPHEKPDNTITNNEIHDESSLVQEIADWCGNMDTNILDNEGKNIFEDMELCSWIMEMPYKTGTFPNHLDMCQHGKSDGCRVFLNGGYGNNTVSYGHIHNILYDMYNHKKFLAMLRYISYYAKHENISRLRMVKNSFKMFWECNHSKTSFLDDFVPENVFISKNILKDYNLKERFMCNERMIMSRKFLDSVHYPDFLDSTGLFMYLGIFETKFGLYTNMLLRDPTKDIRLLSFCKGLPYNMFTYKGEPRWLIRHSFKNLLPSSILDTWQQSGILNSDWVIRVERDWNKLYPELLKTLDCDEIHDYIFEKHLRKYLADIDFTSKRDRRWLTHICSLYCLTMYIRSTKF